MVTITRTDAMNIAGIELRTSNDEAFQSIPPFWQKFYQEGILDRIPNKLSRDIYAVYTNFENEGKNNNGIYSLIIGARVGSLDEIPPEFASVRISESNRAVFPVAAAQPDKVGEKWQEIWELTDLDKTYVADYELYSEDGRITIYVGVA